MRPFIRAAGLVLWAALIPACSHSQRGNLLQPHKLQSGSASPCEACSSCDAPAVKSPTQSAAPGTPPAQVPGTKNPPTQLPPTNNPPANPANPMQPMAEPPNPMQPAPNPMQPAPNPMQPAPNPMQPAPTPMQPNPAPAPQPAPSPAAQQAQPTEGGTTAAASFKPSMFGDQGPLTSNNAPLIATLPGGVRISVPQGQSITLPAGTVLNRSVTIVQNTVNPNVPPGTVIPAGQPLPVPVDVTASAPNQASITTELPLAVDVLRGGFKIAENESVRPQDRLYITYNYFSNINRFAVPEGTPDTNVHRQTLGWEQTFWDGDASIGLRLPFLQVEGGFSTRNRDAVGDLSFITKFAWINEPDFVFSSGMVLTLPTGGIGAAPSITPEVHPTVYQPWVGVQRVEGSWFFQGFSSVAMPTDERDVTFFFNDIQLGYIIETKSSGLLSYLMPVAEVHINTPLTHREIFKQPIGAADIVNLTGGVAFGFSQRGLLNLGVVTPVTGPRPFDIEALVQLNLFY